MNTNANKWLMTVTPTATSENKKGSESCRESSCQETAPQIMHALEWDLDPTSKLKPN
jgi:hypothetical protein